MENTNLNQREIDQTQLNTEDKIRIFKGMLLLFLFSTMIVSSLAYYNAPNINPNLVFESFHNADVKHDRHVHNYPIYKLSSRSMMNNRVELDIILERIGRTNNINSEYYRNVKLVAKFSKNKVRIRMFNNEMKEVESKPFEIPKYLFDYNDFDLENDAPIKDLDESNLGLLVFNHPFGFKIFRKETGDTLFDTSHSFDSDNFNHYTYLAKNYMQISSRLSHNHYSYGLGERFTDLRLKNGNYVMYSENPSKIPVFEDEPNAYSSQPIFVTLNSTNLDGYGVVFINSSPLEAILDNKSVSFIMTSGLIDFYVLNGPRPKEIVMQLQKTLGNPVLPPYNAINWNLNLISVDPEKDLPEALRILKRWNETENRNYFDSIWIDHEGVFTEGKVNVLNNFVKDCGLEVFQVKRSPILKEDKEIYDNALHKNLLIRKSKDLDRPVEGKTNVGEVGFLDYLNPNSTDFVKSSYFSKLPYQFSYNRVLLTQNEPSHLCKGSCDREGNKISLPYTPRNLDLLKNTLPIFSVQYGNLMLLDTHNLYALQEVKVYNTILRDFNIQRPVIFSKSGFLGSNQFSGKWLGNLPHSNDGLKYSLIQTMNFNLFGNPNVVHEACGYGVFDKDITKKAKSFDVELCLRWVQAVSVQPWARINNIEIFSILQDRKDDMVKLINSLRYRLILGVYIYSYIIKNALDGGSFIRPIFFDFKPSNEFKNEVLNLYSQYMIGTNLMVSPVVKAGERQKRTYFPEDKFYDFFDGNIVNSGEEWKNIEAPLDKLLIFLRAGFIVHYQTPTKFTNTLQEMRSLPLEIVVGLDMNNRAYGRMYIDDGISGDVIRKKNFYRLDITAAQIDTDNGSSIQLIFKVMNRNYLPRKNEYPGISRIKLYGYNRTEGLKRVSKVVNNQRQELQSDQYIYNEKKGIVLVQNLNINMDEDTILIFI